MFELLKDNYFKRVLLLAVLLRVLVMPFLFHPDIKVYNFQGSFLQDGVVDIYQHLQQEKKNLPLKEEFVYFPLAYFYVGTYQWIMKPFLGMDFDNWLENKEAPAGGYPVFRYLFILKLPILLVDMLCAFVLVKLFDSSERKKVFALWLLNPFSIVILYIFSNIDILSVFFILLSLSYLKSNHLSLSSVMLGVGAGFKVFPLLILPFLYLYSSNLKTKIKVVLFGFASFLLIILPFMMTQGFRDSTLASGLTTRLLILNLNIGFGETLLVGVCAVFVLYILAYLKDKISYDDIFKYSLAIFLLVFSFIHFHIQWLLWLLPGMVYLSVKYNKLSNLGWWVLFIGVMIPMLYEDRFMSVSLYSLINDNFNLLPIPLGVFSKIYSPYVIQSLLHTIFTSLSLILVYKMFKEGQR